MTSYEEHLEREISRLTEEVNRLSDMHRRYIGGEDFDGKAEILAEIQRLKELLSREP